MVQNREPRVWFGTRTISPYLSRTVEPSDPHSAEFAVLGVNEIKLEDFPELIGIFRCGVGTDNIPFEKCAERGVRVGLPGDESRNQIFHETAAFASYSVLRALYNNRWSLEAWSREDRRAVSASEVLVLGNGNIGSRVVKFLEPFVQISIWDPATAKEEDLLPQIRNADVVSLHFPLASETAGWFDREKISNMKDGAVLINTARGALCDEDALLAELSRQRLTYIADVFSQEPYTGPLLDFEGSGLIATPHVASHSKELAESLAKDFELFVDTFELSINARLSSGRKSI